MKKKDEKKQEQKQTLDPYAIVEVLVTTIAQTFGIPQPLVQMMLMQVRRTPRDKLLKALKMIYKELKKYGDELDD